MNGITVTDLRPCLLVAIDVSRSGGQSYTREDEQIEKLADGSLKATWTTKKRLDNEAEFSTATKLQTACKYAASKLGRHTPVGIVSAVDRREEIQEFRDSWKRQIDEFNATAQFSRISFTLMVFEIKGENVQALETVLDDLRDGLKELEEAYKSFSPKSIREVVQKMNGFVEVLPERAGFLVDEAIKEAREKANKVSRGEKKLSKIEMKIAEELGPDADVTAELARLAKQPLSARLRIQTQKIVTLAQEKDKAVSELEAAKQRVNDTPIRLARFAVQRPSQNAEDRSADLMGVRAAARFANG